MPFVTENTVSPFVTGLSSFLIGRDQQRRLNRGQEIKNKETQVAGTKRAVERLSDKLFALVLAKEGISAQSARNQSQFERENLRQEEISERQRAMNAQQTLNARIDLLPPRAQAEFFTAKQRNTTILADPNMTQEQRQQAIGQNNQVIEAIFQNNPPQKIKTTQDLIDEKQIIINDDFFIVPKGFTVKERKGFIGDEGTTTSQSIADAKDEIIKELEAEKKLADKTFPFPNKPRFGIIEEILRNPAELRRLAEDRVINNMRGSRRVDEAAVAGEALPTNTQIQQQQQQAQQQAQQQDQLIEQAFDGFQTTSSELAELMDKSGPDPSKLSEADFKFAKEAAIGLSRSLQVIGQGLTPEQREQLKPIIEYAKKVLEQ